MRALEENEEISVLPHISRMSIAIKKIIGLFLDNKYDVMLYIDTVLTGYIIHSDQIGKLIIFKSNKSIIRINSVDPGSTLIFAWNIGTLHY